MEVGLEQDYNENDIIRVSCIRDDGMWLAMSTAMTSTVWRGWNRLLVDPAAFVQDVPEERIKELDTMTAANPSGESILMTISIVTVSHGLFVNEQAPFVGLQKLLPRLLRVSRHLVTRLPYPRS